MRYKLAKRQMFLSVRDLAGGEEVVGSYGSFRLRAKAGQSIHLQYQAEIPERAVAEYPIKFVQQVDDWEVVIRGKADVVIRSNDSVEVEEIKSVSDDLLRQSHVLQLQIYAHYFRSVELVKHVSAVLVSIDLGTAAVTRTAVPIVSLADYIEEFAREQIALIAAHEDAKQVQSARVDSLQFPYAKPRPYQQEIIERVTDVLPQEARIMLSAPPGIGKTLASLYPALGYALKSNQKVFAVTSKTTQQRIFKATLKDLHKAGAKFNAIIVSAKAKICHTKEYDCENNICEYLDHFSGLDAATRQSLVDSLLSNKVIESRAIKRIARKHGICPFELSMDVALQCDVVVCDYNYVFHPSAGFQRYQQAYPHAVLIVDEAHNLVNRATSYYSESLSVADLKKLMDFLAESSASDRVKALGRELLRRLARLILTIDDALQTAGRIGTQLIALTASELENFQAVQLAVDGFVIEYLNEQQQSTRNPLVSFSDKLKFFTQLLAEIDFVALNEFSLLYNLETMELRIQCKSAAAKLRKQFRRFHAVIVQSATIQPFEYFRTLLGLPDSTELLDYPSPFPPEHKVQLIYPDITTTYRERSADVKNIAELIMQVVNLHGGNYLLFFPSFMYLQQVKVEFEHIVSPFTLITQRSTMSDSQRNKVLNRLSSEQNILVLGVMGSVFSEGVDYFGDMAIGVFVISPGLPSYSFEQELIKEYFERQYRKGFEYAYRNPGINKVVQAAGRIIRSETDKGIIVLIGKRFATNYYKSVLPSYWNPIVTHDIVSVVQHFWDFHSDS